MRIVFSFVVLSLLALGAWLTREHWPDPRLATSASTEPVTQSSSAAAPLTTTKISASSPGASTNGAKANGKASGDKATGTGQIAAPSVAAQVTHREAKKFVTTLTEPDTKPITVERADHFVTGEQMLSLVPKSDVQRTTVTALRNDASLSLDTPITVVRDVEQVERATPEKLIATSAGNLDAPIQVLHNNEVRQSTVRQVLERASRSPDRPIDVVTQTQYFEQTTLRELAQSDAEDMEKPIKIIRKHHAQEAASIAELMRTHEVKSGSLFYVRTVREGDEQGIWGIVHGGIIDNFARGMAIRRGKKINRYQVDIPSDADERRADASSSFLGQLIFNKSKASHVYNFRKNRMGRNPHRIFPGQEIVIIDFQPEELIEIYKHFVAQRG